MVEQARSEAVERSAKETSDGGPVLRAISKRLRAYNKKIKRAEEIEAFKATGKDINDQQEEVLAGRGKAEAVVAELQRLVPLLEEAVKEETKDAVQRGLAEQAAKAEAAEPAHQAAAPPTPEREAVPAGFPTENGSVPSSEAVTEAVERLVQLAYFTQVFNPEGGFPAAHERKVCVDYDQESFTNDTASITTEDLSAIAKFGQLLTKRAEGSHQEALDSGKRLALAWVGQSDEPVPGTRFTVAELAAKFSRVVASPYVSTPPTVNNEDAESVVPLDDSAAKDSPAPSAHGGTYPAPLLSHQQQYLDQGALMTGIYEPNGMLHTLPVNLADLPGERAAAAHASSHWAAHPSPHLPLDQLPQHLGAVMADSLGTAGIADQGVQASPEQHPGEWIDPSLVAAPELNGEAEPVASGSGPVDFNFMVESKVADDQATNGPGSAQQAAVAGDATGQVAENLPRSRSGGNRDFRGRGRGGRGGGRGDRPPGGRGERGEYVARGAGDKGRSGGRGRGRRPGRPAPNRSQSGTEPADAA